MADGKITGKDIIDDSAFRRIDELIAKLDESIKKFREIEKSGKAAYSPDNIGELSKAQQKLAEETDQTVKATKEQIEAVKEQTRQETALRRARAQASQAGSDTNRQIQEERAARNAINKDIRDEIKLRRQQQTAYGRLRADVARLEAEYKELAASQQLNTVQGKALTKEFNRQKTALDRVDRSARDFRSNVGNYPSALSGATNAIRGFVGAFGIIEGLRLGGEFIRDSIEVAQAARGVEFAFQRLGERGVAAFEDIRTATRGTLSDLDIKTSINEFENFNIDLEESGVLFEFLAVRAQQTGKSIDSLRDSLVEGLSKESKLRIDNLGISTAALNEELEKTPNFVEAVANIARRELKDAGDVLATLANSPQAVNAAFQNLQLTVGSLFTEFNGFGFITDLLNQARESVIVFSSGINNLKDGAIAAFEPFFNLIKQIPGFDKVLGIFQKLFNTLNDPIAQKIGRVFTILGAQLTGVGAAAGVVIDRFVELFNAFKQLADVDLSNPVAFIASLQANANNLVDVLGEGAGQATADAYQEAYTRALKQGQERTNAALEQTFADPVKPDGPVGREIVQNVKDVFAEGLKESEEFAKALEESLGADRNAINTDATIQGLEEIAKKAEEVANRTKTSSESLAASLLEINEETFELAEGLFSQFQNLTGISSEVFSDLAFDTADTDTAFQAIEGLSQRAFDAQQQRLNDQLQANQDYLQQIRSDERLSAEEKIALEQRVAEEEKRIRQEQAKAQKQVALFSVAIDTAKAIAAALTGPTLTNILGKIATITTIGAAQAALIASQPLPQFFKGKGPLDNYEGLATWGERGQEVLVTPGGEMYVSPNKTTPLYVGKDDIIVPSFSQFDRELNSKGEVFNRLQTKMSKETREREEFNYKQFEKSVYSALKRAGVGPVNINLDARRYRY